MDQQQHFHYSQEDKHNAIIQILQAKQEEKYLGPVPNQEVFFTQELFFQFNVTQGNQNIKIHTYREPAQNPKALLILFHGFNNHLNSGAIVAKLLSKQNIEVVGFDYRGFGKSEGDRAYIESIDTIVQDSIEFVQKMKQIYPNLPIFASGLSLGGLIVFLLSHKLKGFFKGVILFAPALRDFPAQYYLKKIARILGYLTPKLKLVSQDFYQSNKNRNCSEFFRNSKYSYTGKYIPGSIRALFLGMEQSESLFSEYCEPFLCIMGKMDKIVDPFAAIDLYHQCKSQDKQLELIDNLWHNIWNESEIFEIMDRVIIWINNRI